MNKRLNILYVVNALRQTSSPLHEHVLPMSLNHNIVVCSYGPIETKLPPEVIYYSGEGKFNKFVSALKLALHSEKHDVVHFHAPHSASLSLLYLLVCRGIRKASTVYTVHNSFSRYSFTHLALLYFVFLNVDKIVHCSQASYDSFSEKIGGLFSKRRTVIPNGVNLQFVDTVLSKIDPDYNEETRSSNHGQVTKIITIGRLVTVKNHTLLLHSLAKIKNTNFSLKIIGAGPLLEELKSEAKDLLLESKVEFTGVITRENVYCRLADSDLFISTSTLEGLPLSVLESLACGCPVILSDIPSHQEVLDEFGSVKIVESNDVAGFVSAINDFSSLNTTQRFELSRQCRSHVSRNHSMQVMNKKYLSLYESSLKG